MNILLMSLMCVLSTGNIAKSAAQERSLHYATAYCVFISSSGSIYLWGCLFFVVKKKSIKGQINAFWLTSGYYSVYYFCSDILFSCSI